MYHFKFVEKFSESKIPEWEVKYGKIKTEYGAIVPDEFTCEFVKRHMKFIDRLSINKVIVATLYTQDFICGDRFKKLKDAKWKFKFNF